MSSSYQLCLSSHFHWYDAEKIELFQIHLVVLLWDFQNYFADFQTLHHLDSRMWHAAKKKDPLEGYQKYIRDAYFGPKNRTTVSNMPGFEPIFGEPTKLFWWICSSRLRVNWIFCASSRIELFNFACKRRGQQKTSLRDPRSKPSSSQTSSYAGIREDANHHPVRRLSKRRWMKKIFTYSFSLMRCLDP